MNKPEKFDVLIAGSSLAEFSAGIVLQKFFGKKTAIVTGINNNNDSQPVDFLSASLFAGQMEPDSFIRKISNYLTDNKLTWEKLPTVYERHFYPKWRLNLSDNLAAYMGELKKLFPKDKGNIDIYFRDIQHAADYTSFFLLRFILPPILHAVSERFFATGKKFATLSVEEFIDSFSQDKNLKTALSGQLQNFASCRESTGFIFHAMNMMGTLNGAFAPKGGPGAMYNLLKSSYISHGGTLLESSTIDEITISGKQIKELSVIDLDGTISPMKCKKIFWGMGMENLPALVKDEKTRAYLTDLSPVKEFVPYPILFQINFNDGIKKLTSKGEIFRLFPSNQADADEIPQGCNLYPVYSAESTDSIPDKYIAVVFVNGDDPGAFLQNEKSISDLKDYLMDMINLYIKDFGGCISSVEQIKPGGLTKGFYINPFGTVMPSTGKIKTQLHKNPYRLNNLFVTGADLFIPGVTASIMSGITTVGVAFGSYRFFRFFRYLKQQANKKVKIKIKPLKVKRF
ncbi:MAG: hypothetical protein IPJ75_05160 [Ignavibacteriales bacterium]|nr:hypothetical protein [Ignavibacteriales bacterium]